MLAKLTKYARYVVTAIWIVAGAWLMGATAGEARTAWLVTPTPPEVLRDITVRNVTDDEGRRATFRILLFSDEFRWRINSYDSLEQGGKRPQFTTEMKAVLNSASEIIAVGASSEELPPGASFPQGRAQEERRAARRAERIAVWVQGSVESADPGAQAQCRSSRPDRQRRHLRSTPHGDHPRARPGREHQHRSVAEVGDGGRERPRADLRSAADQVLTRKRATASRGCLEWTGHQMLINDLIAMLRRPAAHAGRGLGDVVVRRIAAVGVAAPRKPPPRRARPRQAAEVRGAPAVRVSAHRSGR